MGVYINFLIQIHSVQLTLGFTKWFNSTYFMVPQLIITIFLQSLSFCYVDDEAAADLVLQDKTCSQFVASQVWRSILISMPVVVSHYLQQY